MALLFQLDSLARLLLPGFCRCASDSTARLRLDRSALVSVVLGRSGNPRAYRISYRWNRVRRAHRVSVGRPVPAFRRSLYAIIGQHGVPPVGLPPLRNHRRDPEQLPRWRHLLGRGLAQQPSCLSRVRPTRLSLVAIRPYLVCALADGTRWACLGRQAAAFDLLSRRRDRAGGSLSSFRHGPASRKARPIPPATPVTTGGTVAGVHDIPTEFYKLNGSLKNRAVSIGRCQHHPF